MDKFSKKLKSKKKKKLHVKKAKVGGRDDSLVGCKEKRSTPFISRESGLKGKPEKISSLLKLSLFWQKNKA